MFRRYADVVVHRLLAAAIEGEGAYQTTAQCEDVASRCNERKQAAKRAQVGILMDYFFTHCTAGGKRAPVCVRLR